MFWNKKDEINEEKVLKQLSSCSTDKDLPECESISKIREWQSQIDELNILSKYDMISTITLNNFGEYDSTFNIFIEKILKLDFLNNEEVLGKVGRELDNHKKNKKTFAELTEKINLEKEKLGIK